MGLVTGSSRGIGKAIAIELNRAGARLALHGRTETPQLKALERSMNAQSPGNRAFAADVSEPPAVRRLIRSVGRWSSRLDFVVANAGIYAGTSSRSVDHAEWEAVIGTNLEGAFGTVQAALPMLARSDHPSVVFVSSVLGSRPSAEAIPYQASKAGVEQMTRALALELAPKVRVNAVAPGFIRTDMNRAGRRDRAFREQVERDTPLGRWGEPEDIASVARYLVSDESSWVTGTVVLIDGGLRLQ